MHLQTLDQSLFQENRSNFQTNKSRQDSNANFFKTISQQKTERLKEHIQQEEFKECTFAPKINDMSRKIIACKSPYKNSVMDTTELLHSMHQQQKQKLHSNSQKMYGSINKHAIGMSLQT